MFMQTQETIESLLFIALFYLCLFFNIVFYFKVISLDIWICRGIIVYIWTKDILAYIFSWSGFRLQAILKALGSNLF